MLGFLAMLVQAGVFTEILMSFLPVGHTHADIDQMFSRIVLALLCRNARSFEELKSVIGACYRDKYGRRLNVHLMKSVRNFSDFIDAYVPARLEGITRFRQFIIRKDPVEGHVVIRARARASGKGGWGGLKENTDSTPIFRLVPSK